MGKIIKVSGPLVVADGMADANMADVVRVGPQQLILCSTDSVSGTVPRMSPTATVSPTAAVGVKSHSLSRSSGGT